MDAKRRIMRENKCIDCRKEISLSSKRCHSCANRNRKGGYKKKLPNQNKGIRSEMICHVCKIKLDDNNCYLSNLKNWNRLCRECNKIKSREWRLKNLEKDRLRKRKRWTEHHQELLEYKREYRKNNREKLNKKSRERYKLIPKEEKERWGIMRKEWWEENRQKVIEELGGKCRICERNNRKLFFHNIKNEKHSFSPLYYQKHKKEFLLVCGSCHKGIHFCEQELNINLEKILEIKRGGQN